MPYCEHNLGLGTGARCGKPAVRPVENYYGGCVWACAKHGRRKKTYKIYRPRPSILDELAAVNDKRKWWHYAYIGTA
jgi:hypothetical protein